MPDRTKPTYTYEVVVKVVVRATNEREAVREALHIIGPCEGALITVPSKGRRLGA